VGGTTHAGDAVAAQAQSDVVIAYDDAAGRAPTATISGDLVGQTLVDGVYKSTGPIGLSGTLTLDAQGDPNSVWVFQIASTLITASSSRVALINGAQACNVYWQVGSSATLGTTSTFTGTILALTSISVTTGTVVEGQALARNGAVTLDNNTFTEPGCDLSPIPTQSASQSVSQTPSQSQSASQSVSQTPSQSQSVSQTPSQSQSVSQTPSQSQSVSQTPLSTETATPSRSSELAETGAGPLLGMVLGISALLLVAGSALLMIRRARFISSK
jgi:hypothetical protein